MLDDVLDGEVDRKERLLREKFLGGHILVLNQNWKVSV